MFLYRVGNPLYNPFPCHYVDLICSPDWLTLRRRVGFFVVFSFNQDKYTSNIKGKNYAYLFHVLITRFFIFWKHLVWVSSDMNEIYICEGSEGPVYWTIKRKLSLSINSSVSFFQFGAQFRKLPFFRIKCIYKHFWNINNFVKAFHF